jgi:formate/nitrite transporter FocA (FNT family)
METLRRPVGRLLHSGVSAGLDLSFSVYLMAIVHTLAGGATENMSVSLVMGSMYAFGFIMVILGRSDLYTEHTTLAALPVLSGYGSVGALFRLWAMVYVSNLTGAAAFAGLLALVGPELEVVEASAFGQIAEGVIAETWWVMLLAATLAGWLMGLLSWLVAAGRDTISQVVLVWLITGAIGMGHLPHVVVGTTEVLAGVFVQERVGVGDFVYFLVWTTIGNTLGGVFFVALLKYSHSTPPTRREA